MQLRLGEIAAGKQIITYSVFMAFLDIDRIPELMQVSPFCSYNRWNWASFDERDHFGDPARPQRERLTQDAAAQGLPLPGGRIFLLTHLRYLTRALLVHPWMTAKVITAIHREALKLYLKKVPVFAHPAKLHTADTLTEGPEIP